MRRHFRKIALFLSVLGPGVITATIDNDASGITTYSVAGARYGYALLWTLLPTTVSLIVVQEMVARMGIVTGKGLSALIRENYGVKVTFYLMLGLFIANLGTTVANLSGWAASMEILGVSKYTIVPLGSITIWFLVTKGTYRIVERILLLACILYFGYVVAGVLARPEWHVVAKRLVIPQIKIDPGFIMLTIAIIGTTITPWMQFFLQSSIAEKGLKKEDYRTSRLDVILGCSITGIVSFFIIVTCATTLFPLGIRINNASEAAMALRPFAGNLSLLLFAISLANASILGAIIVPLATAYYASEAMGWEAGVNKKFKEAPHFMWIYTSLIVIASLMVLVPGIPLVTLMVLSSVINGFILPFVLTFALKLSNNRKIMGDYINSRVFNIIAWATVTAIVILSICMLIFVFLV